ncbi:MAG TPA: hypothetical protein VM491_19500 [Burkholderiaceae bacterium]|jgi:hypothetical protein|nr:hypothetical protein [Burkholderiaceae bacterium]
MLEWVTVITSIGVLAWLVWPFIAPPAREEQSDAADTTMRVLPHDSRR